MAEIESIRYFMFRVLKKSVKGESCSLVNFKKAKFMFVSGSDKFS